MWFFHTLCPGNSLAIDQTLKTMIAFHLWFQLMEFDFLFPFQTLWLIILLKVNSRNKKWYWGRYAVMFEDNPLIWLVFNLYNVWFPSVGKLKGKVVTVQFVSFPNRKKIFPLSLLLHRNLWPVDRENRLPSTTKLNCDQLERESWHEEANTDLLLS